MMKREIPKEGINGFYYERIDGGWDVFPHSPLDAGPMPNTITIDGLPVMVFSKERAEHLLMIEKNHWGEHNWKPKEF